MYFSMSRSPVLYHTRSSVKLSQTTKGFVILNGILDGGPAMLVTKNGQKMPIQVKHLRENLHVRLLTDDVDHVFILQS